MLDTNKRLWGFLTGISLAMTGGLALADSNNLLKDPSFELRLLPDEGGWSRFEESVFSTDQARTGSQAMLNGGMSRPVAYPPYFVGMVSGSFQELPATPGSRWRMTGYGLAANQLKGTPAFGIIQVSFFDAEGKDLGTVETSDSAIKAKTSAEVNNQTTAGEWVFLDTGVATAPAGTATIQAFTLFVDYSGSNAAQDVHFDDLSLCMLDGDSADSCGD